MPRNVPRLIQQFKPGHYDLRIDQDSKNLTFNGRVDINGVLPEPTDRIILHSDALKVIEATADDQPCLVRTQADKQTILLKATSILRGKISLRLAFRGTITRQMHGLYPCEFSHNGQKKRLLATQFESHHAREVFPCIDEPEAKATFKLTLTTGTADVVVSNTPIEAENIKAGRKTTIFQTTPRMSTYLLAWVTGDLLHKELKTDHGVVIRAYCTPEHVNKTGFGLDVAKRALDFMDDYFGIPYPLSKCDIIALPDFAAGAMENWGCVTFRESAMLVDPDHSDLSDKQHVAEVIVHELAHQWFGNLVTMRWWEDLWLNEGFASWIPYMVLDHLYPEWDMWEQFSSGDLMIGLRADALSSTHPIVVPIHGPEEIRSAFDSISYDKGCSVIHLLYRYIGAEAFRDGLRYYLKKYAYENAETNDLWQAWETISQKPVRSFMSTWTTKPGFPLIMVAPEEDGYMITQRRFYLNPDHPPSTTIWPVPLMRRESDQEILTRRSSKLVSLEKLNRGQAGFYRAIYQDKAAEDIAQQIKKQALDPIDVLGVINDMSEAAKAGYCPTTAVLPLMRTITETTNESLMSTVLGELGGYRMVLHDTYEPMKPFVAALIKPNLNRLGRELIAGEPPSDELLRPTILASASYSGDSEVIEWALELFSKANTPEDIRPDLRPLAYQTAIRERGDKAAYDKLLGWYNTTTIPGERISLVNALTNARDPELIKRTLDYITTDAVKLQDAVYWIGYSLLGRHSKYQAWDWLRAHWDWIGRNYSRDKEVDYFLRYTANGFATESHLEDYVKFFSSVDIFGSKRAFEQGRETIAWQSAWKKRDENNLVLWFNKLS